MRCKHFFLPNHDFCSSPTTAWKGPEDYDININTFMFVLYRIKHFYKKTNYYLFCYFQFKIKGNSHTHESIVKHTLYTKRKGR